MIRQILQKLLASALGGALVAVAVSAYVRDPEDPPKSARYYRQQAAAAYGIKNYPLAIENFQKAADLIPDHPTIIYNLACMYALAGRSGDALSALSRVAEMGVIFPADKDNDLASIKDTPEFKRILNRFEASSSPIINSSSGFTIREKGLITEGLAYYPADDTFFVSSVHKRKILQVGKGGEVSAFASEQEGLFSVLGMTVDAKRRHLWAASTAFPQMVNFKKEEDGTSAVFKFDLRTKKLLKRYVLSNAAKKHALGDLTVGAGGDVFITDSVSPAVYVIHPQQDEIELFLEDPAFGSPQGLTFSSDGRHLFMADYATGLFDIDVSARRVIHLAPLAGATLLGIDGLYFYNGSLIGVQNGVKPQRVVRVLLSKDYKRAARLEVIEANNPIFLEPTLGVIVKDTFYFIANSQWPLVDENGRLAPEDKLREPAVLRIKLDAR